MLGLDRQQRSEFFRNTTRDVGHMLAQYVRAQMLLALFAAVAFTLFLWAIHFPVPLLLGAVAGVLELIPLLAPLLTAGLLLVVALLAGNPHWLMAVAFVGIWRLLQDYLISPLVMRRGLHLHPLTSISAVYLGGELVGWPGLFLSIPVVAALRIVWRNYQAQRLR